MLFRIIDFLYMVMLFQKHLPQYQQKQAKGLYTPEQLAKLQPYLASLAVREDMRGRGIGRKLVEAAGGRFLYVGAVESLFLGVVEELWDAVGLVEYPSPKSLVTIVSSPDFQEIEKHRVAGLAGQLNIAARTQEAL